MDLKQQQGFILKRLRDKRDITQEQLAFRSGVSVDSIRQLETGVKLARVDTVFKLLKGLEENPIAFYTPLWESWDTENAKE